MRRAALAVAALALALAACDEGALPCDGGLCVRDDGPPADRPDLDPECTPPARPLPGLGCTPPPEDRPARCALVDALGLACEDRDGDCACADEVPAEAADWLLDCDDGRVAAWPGAAERCDGLDNDCDGAVDEDFDLGGRCRACARDGVWECAAAGSGLACSVAAGQSEAPAPDESCNQADDDCDGAVDEACRVRLAPPATLAHPAACGGGRYAVVLDGALWTVAEDERGGWQAAPVPAADPDLAPAYPACSPSLLAWLTTPQACAAPADGPVTCPQASVWALDTDQAVDLTGPSSPGPPVVRDDALMWHAMVGDQPRLKRHDRGQRGLRDVLPDLALSDPTPPRDGRWAARRWIGGSPEVVRWLGDAFDDAVVPLRPSGRPALGDRWLVWVLDDAALWAVPLDGPPAAGFQLTAGGGPHRAPRVVGDHVVWVDEGAPALRHLDLRTGTGGVLYPGRVAPEDLAAGDDEVVWVGAGPAGPALYRHRFSAD